LLRTEKIGSEPVAFANERGKLISKCLGLRRRLGKQTADGLGLCRRFGE
jgi:hypothetical protein